MEQIRGTGSQIVEAEIVDHHVSKETGVAYGIAIIDGERICVVRFELHEFWYVDAGEIVR